MKGVIEDLTAAGIQDNSVDIVMFVYSSFSFNFIKKNVDWFYMIAATFLLNVKTMFAFDSDILATALFSRFLLHVLKLDFRL